MKGNDLEFGEFLQLIGIWMVMAENPGTNGVEYYSKNPIDLFSGCSIRVNQFMSGNCFEYICSTIKFTERTPPHLHPF